MKFSIYQESRVGGRRENQDRVAYCYSRDAVVMIVADGMGGHLHGEVAAQIAVQFIAEAFQREATPKLADPVRFLLDSITNAHFAILDYAEVRRLLETPRTTCVACVVQDGVAYWAHVGDSRLYLLREGRVEAQTKDHSRVQMLVDLGRIREEAVGVHPERNKIFNCLGQMNPPKVELSRRALLKHGDTILLCSDGFWGPLSGRVIGEQLADGNVVRGVPELLDLAEARAGRDSDNLSVIALTWAEEVAGAGEWISTLAMDANEKTTKLSDWGKSDAQAHSHLTDDEIERAIDEIRTAIHKHSG
ncbi:MAG: protein phosphatase 2C domain-containing protein [Burkholderiales bacterium]|jgi:serine/threonine protein phosphatase PrpC|nr:protein phosphatase 2C domain-containing protein [Burkholderiales bacterium]